MTRKKREKIRPARPIKTRRDYEGAAAVAKRMSGETERTSAAELRLQSLLRELDRFDATEDDAGTDSGEDYDSAAPRRRWSDDEEGLDSR